MQRIFVSLLVAACLLCTATALVESPDPTSGAVFVSQHVSAPSLIEAPGGPSHNTRNGLFHPGGRRVDHTSADDEEEDDEDDSQQKVSHDPSQNGDEGDDENAEESGEEEAAQEDQGSDAEDLNAERRAERLADRYGGIPEDYLGKDVDKIIQTRRDARQQSLIDAPKGHLSLFPPREMDEESDEDAPAPAPALASNVRAAPHGGRAGLGPRMQQVNSPSTFPETPAVSMSGNFVPGAGAMSMAEGIDPSYDVTSPADQAMYAFEQQQKLMMSGMPSIPMEGGGIMEQNIPLPRFGGVQQPQMPEFGGAPQMEQEPMMDRPKPEVKFVDPRFASARGPAPQRMPTRGFAQRGPADQEEEMQEEAPQRGAEPTNEFRFRATSGSGASKASSKKWDHSQSHITQRFLSNIGYARQQRAMQRRRENGRDHPHDAAAPEAEAKQEQEQETQQQNLGVPPPPDFRAPSLMEEEARVHSHTAQGHTHRVAQRVTSEAESEAVPARRTRYERMFARPAPRARRGSLLEVDAASEAMDSMESREVQGKPAGLPDEPEFEAPPPDPSAAQASAPTGPAGLREEVYSPPHVVV